MSNPQETLDAEIMKEVKRYDDGMGCTRRQLVDNILILFSQYTRVRDSAAATVDALDDQEFYELMQAYRHANATNQSKVCERYERVKAYIRAAASPVAPRDEAPPDDGWVTFGRVKIDIENETQTFERIDPNTAASSSPPPRELAQKAADEIEREIIRLGGFKHAIVFNANSIRIIIERYFSTGRSEPSDPTSASTQQSERHEHQWGGSKNGSGVTYLCSDPDCRADIDQPE